MIWLFSIVTSIIVFFSFFLVFSTNPGYTIFSFISIVLCFTIFLFICSTEFFAFILLYIYIGGIMVLFIFFIMMVGDIYPINYYSPFTITSYFAWIHQILYLVGYLCLIVLIWYVTQCGLFPFGDDYVVYIVNLNYTQDLFIIGNLLFNMFFLDLFFVSLILLLTMVGPINLLMFRELLINNQVPAQQLNNVVLLRLTLRSNL